MHSPVLVACAEAHTRAGLFRVMHECRLPSVFSTSVREVRTILARHPVRLLVCGTRLDDGTYLDILRETRRGGNPVRVVVASGLDGPGEFSHFLTALDHGAFAFLFYPYRRQELEKIMGQAAREAAVISRSWPESFPDESLTNTDRSRL